MSAKKASSIRPTATPKKNNLLSAARITKRVRDEDGASKTTPSKRVRVPDYVKPRASTTQDAEIKYADTGPPVHLHALLKYSPKPLSRVETTALSFVEHHFVIPEDIDENKRFGPLSGMSREHRVLVAYSNRLLDLKEPERSWPLICLTCAAEGHEKNDCPFAFE